ncbi:MAG: SagB/ThcOx family dehydrogenase, partial [Candidatus Altarchaeaceae archaeon]
LDIYEISQILWSAIGINKYNERTVPSAGAIYPLEIYLVVNNVENLEKGIYKYDAENNEILKISDKDVSKDLYKSCLYQEYVRDAPAVVVIAGNFEKTKRRYGERGIRYVYMEAGHVVQNVYLQCVSLNLGTVVIGAFYDEEVNKILNINEKVIALMPIGKI